MSPITSILGLTKQASSGGLTATNQSFGAQLQSLLQQTKPNTIAAPSRATTGQMHVGGMDSAAKHLLNLHAAIRG